MSRYKEQKNIETKEQAQAIKSELPEAMQRFLSQKDAEILSANTLLSYATQLREFCRYLAAANPVIAKKPMSEITVEDFAALDSNDATEFQASLNSRKKLSTIKHYRTTLSQFFEFLVAVGDINRNPFTILKIKSKGKKEKKIVYLDENEKQRFLDALRNGEGVGKAYYEKNSKRDIAICELFLSTGIRVSELVGIDIPDIDFEDHSIDVMRKGAQETASPVYMTDRIEEVLKDYIENFRPRYSPLPSDKALFLSYGETYTDETEYADPATGKKKTLYTKRQAAGNRINVKAVERLVKRYVKASVPKKYNDLTVHKLRTTFASTMLRQTDNVELVKDLMGHSSILSTEHYIDSTKDEQKKAIRGE